MIRKFLFYWATPVAIALIIGGMIADMEWVSTIGYYLFLLYAVLRVTIWKSEIKSKNLFYIFIIIIISLILLLKTEII